MHRMQVSLTCNIIRISMRCSTVVRRQLSCMPIGMSAKQVPPHLRLLRACMHGNMRLQPSIGAQPNDAFWAASNRMYSQACPLANVIVHKQSVPAWACHCCMMMEAALACVSAWMCSSDTNKLSLPILTNACVCSRICHLIYSLLLWQAQDYHPSA